MTPENKLHEKVKVKILEPDEEEFL